MGPKAPRLKGNQILVSGGVIRRIPGGHLYASDDVAGRMLNRFVGGESGDDVSPVAMLSDRELDVVNLIGNGMLTREIAAKLFIAPQHMWSPATTPELVPHRGRGVLLQRASKRAVHLAPD